MKSGRKKSYKDSEIVLNFNDAVIHGSDLALLQSRTAWLNDACINFFLEWFKSQAVAPSKTRFMDPSVASFFVHQCVEDDEIEDFVSGLQLETPWKLFVPVNDTMTESGSWGSNTGSHWSLLIVAKSSASAASFWHFDSMGHSGNLGAAETIARKLGKHCFEMDHSQVAVLSAETPLQNNGHDCGLHVLEAIYALGNCDAMDLQTHADKLRQHIERHPNFSAERRECMANEIVKLANRKKIP